MSGLAWLLWLALSGAVMAVSMWHYRRRETPGRGRVLLAVLRALALAVVLLLLFDPQLSARGNASAGGSQVLLDASLSMRLPAGERSRWQAAIAEARERAGERPILLFGDRSRPAPSAALPDTAPGDARTLLLPALQAAAEAGAREVVVITDGGIEDADAVARWAARLGVGIEVVLVGNEAANTALVEASAPQWVDAGESLPVEFAVEGGADSVGVVVRRDGNVIGRTAVPAPAAGRVATGALDLRLEPAGEDGWVRLEVALENGDAVADDDARTLYVQVGTEPPGIALVSFRPDWEPRFLAPVLERSLGLPLQAWLRGATGRYVRLGAGMDAGVESPEEDVRRAVERGQLVVLHGLGIDAPDWAHEAARSAPRVLIFPADESLDLPAEVGPELTGDFFPSATVPASPVAALLTDVEAAGARPLTGLRTVEPPQGAWVPLMATRGRQGPVLPLAVAGETAGRRWAIAPGSGYWQWSFRGGSDRQLYARLWSALAGWLAQERGGAAMTAVRPAAMVLPRGEPIPWVTPAAVADSIHVVLTDAAGNVVSDTTLAGVRGDTVVTAAQAPGHYSYRARAFSGDNVSPGEGVLTVERYSPEFRRGRIDGGQLESVPQAVRGADRRRGGTPLHATAYPYLLIVGLLAAEWILRRRWGLR